MELEYDPLVSFGRHLAATRRKAGVSQETLAYDSGLSRSYLSEVERGLRNVALRNICVLAETLNLPPSVLLEFERVADGTQAEDMQNARGNGSGRKGGPRKVARAGAAARKAGGAG
ncbi:MAG: helix-turn-helix transcriptional regulator [Acidovorax sp.]